ncbi:hypothetical protein HBI56_194260 [Parastagonospora nodorum]|nr:hypothetical protein HBH53_189580 [Parastagonospora nodorum]KAH3962377.1 hypothetical protein HBH51_176220 [Parastagonospora nodorum]KAH3967173.1 hypothetical protein HBH52_191660 [Parastagonospora nodorum]KAH3993037.1 hypothetical protein HBI10_207660 [Parastagonospora nodorum]KAH4010869.1 hypothetical protein HBI13_203830 [Parastagonospora nodorum]
MVFHSILSLNRDVSQLCFRARVSSFSLSVSDCAGSIDLNVVFSSEKPIGLWTKVCFTCTGGTELMLTRSPPSTILMIYPDAHHMA